MKKIISILTTTRADFGILKPLISKLSQENAFDVKIVVSGSHLSPEFGLTYKEIENEGFFIDKKIEILLSSDSSVSVSKSMALAMISFSEYFEYLNPDLLIVLGDRYESLAVACAAMNHKIPIAHIHGGEVTQGAIDDAIRHAITKLSYLHFTCAEEYRKRVIQLGESPDRVYNVGALGVENILSEKLFSKEELEADLGMSLSKPYAVVTYHPVTLDQNSAQYQIENLLEACKSYSEMNFIFTKSNADVEGRIINQCIDKYVLRYKNIVAFDSLGMRKYLTALKYSSMVIGNSSSGIIEAPSFGIPTINIGDRQKGRLMSTSVIQCDSDFESIFNAIEYAKRQDFIKESSQYINPYGNGNVSIKIVKIIKLHLIDNQIDLKKTFYDIGENR